MQLITPDWPAPACVKAFSSTRLGGCSLGDFASLNLGDHVGDKPELVRQNRQVLQQHAGMPTEPVWLQQVHGINVVRLPEQAKTSLQADAVVSSVEAQVCSVMTADCLPVLFCDRSGQQVAAAHAGWRGLLGGVLEATVARFEQPAEVLAWLGPAIGPEVFEVGPEVRQQFIATQATAEAAFQPSKADKWLANLYLLARLRLQAIGVTAIYGGDYCTLSQPELFFSYRRDGQTGRMASCIWLQS
ncbi:peptidoglycan editing factor PgeF [Alkalimonas collagenimarina]|uniref:Purine nucleoside phosphorylase n=1 Tax=Alkalimonas collagenimarina TaxID=400390 RepID=A0ABT9GVU2_9GAMM|nr:peptidoglycan editing factor PgeF [Alkalimonas collagenimarina]MDP4534835.1 peptidoglycan editing factor PgeF [Alkalimonas collagenimarina]